MKTKVVIPVSGGMDSTVLLHYAAFMEYEIYALSFNYGQRHHWELGYAKEQCRLAKLHVVSHKTINLDFFKDIVTSSSLTNPDIAVAQTKDSQGHPQTVNYVPFRNTMMLSIALAHAESVGAELVMHGATQLDTLAGFWDGSPQFLTKINELAALNRKVQIRVDAHLLHMTKAQIIKLGIQYGVDFKLTHTCYDPVQVQRPIEKNRFGTGLEVDLYACGKCTACGGRLKGFIDVGYIDPKPYAIEIPWLKYNCVQIQ